MTLPRLAGSPKEVQSTQLHSYPMCTGMGMELGGLNVADYPEESWGFFGHLINILKKTVSALLSETNYVVGTTGGGGADWDLFPPGQYGRNL